MHRYFLINKPWGMVSQFVSPHNVALLGELDFDFPEGIHAIGRLDKESEGLLLLTTNKKITALLFSGPVPHERTYLVEVKGDVGDEALEKLRTGVSFRIHGGVDYTTSLSKVEKVPPPEDRSFSPRTLSKYLQTSWLTITLTEGKFHQVRKMVASVGHRCLRLVRISIEDLELGGMKPGEVREVDEDTFFTRLKLG